MKKVLFVLPPSGATDTAIESAVKRAKKDGAVLAALYLLEAGAASDVFDKFTDIGFIGDRPSSQVSESLMKQQRQIGYEELGRVQIKAMEEGVDFEPVMEHGAPLERVLSLIASLDASAVIIVRKKQKAIFKYFSRSLADDVKEKASCEVVVIEE
jgi:hypothetical protein